MRKQFIFCVLCMGVISAHAQTKKPAVKTGTATATGKPAPNVLKNNNDSLSYAFGVSVGQYLASQGVEKINSGLLVMALQQSLKKEKTVLDANQANMVISALNQQKMMKAAQAEKDKGAKFLAENKKKAGIQETPSGLQYEVITAGTGEKPTIKDTIVAHYRGTLIDGKEFDNSYSRGEPLEIPVGGVIKGWTEALQMMPVGSKWRLYIPSSLGYGDYGAGSSIPGGAALIFDVELISIKK